MRLSQQQKKYLSLENEYGENSETILTDAKYGFIAGALRKHTKNPKTQRVIREIDDLLTHKFWGLPIFFFFLWVMFQATFLWKIPHGVDRSCRQVVWKFCCRYFA